MESSKLYSGERAWAEIDLNAISANMEIIRRKIGAGVRLMAVVKADGYGHGANEAARAALRGGADYLGVANCVEAVQLRDNGIDSQILILGYTPKSMMPDAVRNDIAVTVFDFEAAKDLSRIAQETGKTAVLHIKLDTGMNRLGLAPDDESIKIVEEINKLPGIFIEGIFTHFAVADSPDLQFTYEQVHKFDDFLRKLSKCNISVPIRHTANSAATLCSEDFYYDMVRIGIAMYGLYPSAQAGFYGYDLKPALSLKARISRIKKIDIGESVGYGRTFFAERETFVATVPLGYADGYSRALSNKAEVLVHGRRAPVIGTICMDQFMIDITEIIKYTGVRQGDPVTLIGEDTGSKIITNELSNWQRTIDHEIVCGISKRIPRIYINEPSPINISSNV